ncbi:hypothetical protein EMPS_02219 [Entomortierella parvispora]|uniref:Uncharacterized protein n=1 Tax=Entomortierella parvispora TaxID=205924 RepID=A0A9P3H4A8_9FUNG|nr:hypothetical protein EMPS_02219 [Entomortierella parvispora]
MSAIGTTRVFLEVERQRLTMEQPLRTSSPSAMAKSSAKVPRSPQQQQASIPQFQQPSPPPLSLPKLTTIPRSGTSSTSSSTTPSPTSSTNSLQNPLDTVSFTFSSPLFYDQKLYIYHSLLTLYQQVGRSIQQHPTVLLVLQYSVAAVHGFTVYLLSVILSVAQLIMITATIENLDWIQSHKPLMLEWDSRFPGFVFPAIDTSYSDSDAEESTEDRSRRHGQGAPVSRQSIRGDRYWSGKAVLKSGDDSMDDGYYSEENQKRIAIQRSMNSTLRRRLARYQQWVPSFWSLEEEQEQGDSSEPSLQEGEEDQEEDEEDAQDRYLPSRIRRALVRTLSSSFGPAVTASTAKGKRVTFNEQVLILGRRRSSEASSSRRSSLHAMTITPCSSTTTAANTTCPGESSSAGSEKAAHPSATSSCASSVSGVSTATSLGSVADEKAATFASDFSPAAAETSSTSASSAAPIPLSSSIAQEKLCAMAKEEAEYQRRSSLSGEDSNGSGTSSPLFQPDPHQQKPTSAIPPPTVSSPPSVSAPTTPALANTSLTSDLKRSTSVPMKIGSFLHRHPQQLPLQATARHSSTFSDASTVGQNPRALPVHLSLPIQPGTGPGVVSLAAMVPTHPRESSEPVSPRTSFSLSTRARRSLSLATPQRPLSSSEASIRSSSDEQGPPSLGRRGSTGGLTGSGLKGKNFMYRIVHPQRYKREMEQQVSEQERQRLLTLAQLQRRHILSTDGISSPVRVTSASESAALQTVSVNSPVLCGDAYYYATSAVYVEGLGAENSMISTSIGTSFPEELQRGKSKKSKKVQRPASYDFGCDRPIVGAATALPTNTEYGYGSENDTSSSRVSEALEKTRKQSSGFLFRRDPFNKKSADSPSTPQRASSTSRLHQLFSNPGQKQTQTQSTSSLLAIPGFSSSAMCGTSSASSSDSESPRPTPRYSSSAAAGAHRLLNRARSSSRNFTSFTALGMPANPPGHTVSAPTTPASAAATLPIYSNDVPQQRQRLQDREMEHTSFAAFGFPSPTTSPVHSAPASPRHSTSSMPGDFLQGRIQAMSDFHANVIRRHPFLEADYLLEQDQHRYLQQQRQQQQQQHLPQHQEVLEDDSQGLFYPAAAAASETEVKASPNASRETLISEKGLALPMSPPPPASFTPVSVSPAKVVSEKSPSRGLSFIRKLSLKKNKK